MTGIRALAQIPVFAGARAILLSRRQTMEKAMQHHRSRDVIWIGANAVRERYLHAGRPITAMTLHRWIRDPRLNFPEPTYFGRFRFWRIEEIEAWEASRPRGAEAAEPGEQDAA